MSPQDIALEAENLWETAFSEIGWNNQHSQKFQEFLSSKRRAAQVEFRQNMQPWLHILEDSIQWLAAVTHLLDDANEDELLDDAGRSILVLVGAACAHSVAIRELVLSGLDSSARATARALDEHLCAALAFLHDQELGRNFGNCSTDEEINSFWYKNLGTKSMKKYLNAIERKAKIPQMVSEAMRDVRDSEISDFSKIVHPSYVGASFTAYALGAKDPGTYGLAMLGRASCFSERTLRNACQTIVYFSMLGIRQLFGMDECKTKIVSFNQENNDHQLVIIGAHVLQNISLKYWDYQIYPNSSQEPQGDYREPSLRYREEK
ncbi:MAG: hypothetical protein ACOH2S_23660 [Janthinobacterium svalbardensis]